MDLLREIWDSLRRNKFRTAMTGFAVAWGIFILVVLLGISNGLENGIMANYGSSLHNSVDIWTMWTSVPYKGLPKYRRLYFTEREAQAVKSLPEVERFSRIVNTYSSDLNMVFGDQSASINVMGVEEDYYRIFKKDIQLGRFLNARDDREKVIVLDSRAVESLATTPDRIFGQFVRINDINFRVIGICLNGDRWRGATVYIPFSTHQTIFSTDHHFDKMCVTMRSGTRNIEPLIKHTLAPLIQFDETDPEAVGVWSQEEALEEQSKVMDAIRLFILLLGLCTLMSGAVGVSNIMLVSVRERTKELGIRKALGAPPRTIMASVVGEALAITTLFGTIGMLLGMGIMSLISNILGPDGGDDQLIVNPTVDIGAVLLALAILIVIGAIAGATPARKAMKIKPIEAMRDK